MKKLILMLAVVVAFGVAALAVFIMTFDADRYRPLVASRMQEALERPVQLERLSLGWRHGAALQVQGLTIAGDQGQPEPLVQVESVSALVRLWPLLHKEIRIASLVLVRPRLRVMRDAQGRVNLLALAAVGGPAAASGQRVTAQGNPVSLEIASLRIEDGTLHWTDEAVSPPMDLRVTSFEVTVSNIAPGAPMNIELSGGLASDTPNMKAKAKLTLPDAASQGSLENLTLTMERLALEQIVPAALADRPHLRGRLTLQLQGRVPTLEPAQVVQALSGSGRFQLSDGVIENLNMVRAVFEKLSMLPGLAERLQERLPPTYAAKLTARDTPLGPLDVSFRAQAGRLQFDALHISTETFQLSGAGTIGLDGTINVGSTLRIEPELSAAIISSVKELAALATRAGEIEIPLAIQGKAPQVAVLPDLNYVASKVLVTKAVDLLGEWLGKEQPEQAQPEGEAPSTESPQEQPADPLGTLLRRALDHRAPSNTPQ